MSRQGLIISLDRAPDSYKSENGLSTPGESLSHQVWSCNLKAINRLKDPQSVISAPDRREEGRLGLDKLGNKQGCRPHDTVAQTTGRGGIDGVWLWGP